MNAASTMTVKKTEEETIDNAKNRLKVMEIEGAGEDERAARNDDEGRRRKGVKGKD